MNALYELFKKQFSEDQQIELSELSSYSVKQIAEISQALGSVINTIHMNYADDDLFNHHEMKILMDLKWSIDIDLERALDKISDNK